MSVLRQSAVLFRTELRDELRAGEVTLVVIPFGLVALLVVPMAIGTEATLLERIGPGIYWVIVLVFGVLVTQRRSAVSSPAVRDMQRLAGVDPVARFAATSAASFLLLIGFEVAAGLATVFLYDPVAEGWLWALLILPLAAAGLAMVGTIAGAVAAGVQMRSSLVPLVVVPVSVPLLLGAAQATEGLRVGGSILRWLLLLAAVDIVLAIAGVLTARPLEEPAS